MAHCVTHRHHLIAKHLGEHLHESLHYVIRAVNKIKRNVSNERLFAQVCLENDDQYNRLLLNKERCRLSESVCLDRFYSLFDSVMQYLKRKDNNFGQNLIISKNRISYMTDLFAKFRETHLKLKSGTLNLFKTKRVIFSFVEEMFSVSKIAQ